ncbi:MAG: MFS transporter, partial [Actinomyces sp.]|nr:MFS transporter [Actinomyces sp.]
AKTAFGFTAGQVMIFAIAANVVAGLATVAFGWVDDKIGPKKVIILSLSAMVVAGFGVFFLHARGPIVFWTLGLALCVFVGPTQSASRSFLSRIIPAGREGEVFGLYATTGRAVSFMAPAMYSLFLMIGKAVTPAGEDYTYWGILGIMLILGVGLALTIPVKADRATLHHMEG